MTFPIFNTCENSSTNMSALVHALGQMRQKTGAHLIVVHHTGKGKARGARGHSLLSCAADIEIEIDERTIRTTKQRYAEPHK